MKKLIKGIKGHLIFFITVAIKSSLSVVFFSYIQNKNNNKISIYILLFIIISALVFTLIDVIRRKLTHEFSVNEILEATKKMASGNFDIYLIPNHKIGNYSPYDLIKEDLNKLAKSLSNNELLKTDFIANVSHEIKTPILVIQNYAKLLEDNTLDEKTKKEYLVKLQTSCKKLNDLVFNILKLNKLENNNLNLNLQKFNLSESVTEQILQYEELIENKKINLVCEIEEDIIINGEQNYLEIVWNNLISNAIKFTSQNGKIQITLKQINNLIIFKIEDDGCGIDKETGKYIFDKFYQGDTSHSKEGNGLGLALVKKVVDILGGEINVESEIGKGTIFVVKLRGDE